MEKVQQKIDKNPQLSGPDPQNSSGELDEMSGKYLTFWTDNQLFGIPIADVVQIVGVQTITAIPNFPEYAKGIINLRGSIIPVIDMRLRLHKKEIPYNERTCIIVINTQQKLIGFIVDAVDEVTKIEGESISNPPQMTKEVTNVYLTGIAKIDNKVVLLLNTEKILNNNENLGIA